MAKIASNIFDYVGNTPLLALSNFNKNHNTNLYAKVEYYNPTGSIKDRVCKEMIDQAFLNNQLKEGYTIIEPTSGNTGIGLACYGKIKGLNVILTMPENMSVERVQLLKAYGAQIVLTPKEKGMQGAIDKAHALNKEIKNSLILDQFNNYNNVLAHYKTTGPEIYKQLEGKIDYFVATIGTGGTITGIAKYLKEKNPNIKIIGVEPAASPFLSKNIKGSSKIQGIGAGFKPSILDLTLIDKIETVTDDDAFINTKQLAINEGLFVGISSGAAMAIASKIAKVNKNKNVVVLFADGGGKYLSTFLEENERE